MMMLKKRSGYCFYCGVRLIRNMAKQAKHTATVDHLTPRSRGGRNVEVNRVPCCRRCNSRKGQLTLGEYIVWMAIGRPGMGPNGGAPNFWHPQHSPKKGEA